MKKASLFIGLILTSTSLVAQISVPEDQKSLYGSVDATWCGNCGNVGIPTTASIYSQVNDKAVFFEMHASASSALHSSVASTLASEFNAFGQPVVTLNGIYQGNLNGSIESQLVNSINSNYNATGADVNAGFEYSLENDTLYVATNTKFFNSLSGEYYTGVYVTEDSIWEFQANYNPSIPNGDIYHFHILRDVLSQDVHGKMVANGTISAGEEFVQLHKIKIDPNWDLDNIHINTVVWKKDGDNFSFVNVNNVGTESSQTLSIEEKPNTTIDITIYPNPSTDIVHVRTNNDQLSTFQIVDNSGRVILSASKIQSNTMDIDVSSFQTGVYFLIGKTENGSVFQEQIIKR